MKIALRTVLLAALLALGVWLWTILFPGPEKLIRKRLEATAQAASFAGKERPLTLAGSLSKLIACFTPDAQITFDAPGRGEHSLNGREEIRQAAMAARSAVASLTVEFLDVNISVGAGKQSAIVELTANGRVPSDANYYVQEMKFTLKKIDGVWLIARVETVKTLK